MIQNVDPEVENIPGTQSEGRANKQKINCAF